jgi:hypothetical protein
MGEIWAILFLLPHVQHTLAMGYRMQAYASKAQNI